MKDIDTQSFDKTTAAPDFQSLVKLDEWDQLKDSLGNTWESIKDMGRAMEKQGILPSLNFDERQDERAYDLGRAQAALADVRPGQTGDDTYTVKKGQGFDAIAKDILSKENPGEKPSQKDIVELSKAIAEANGMDRKSSVLHPGMELIIPGSEDADDQTPGPGDHLPTPEGDLPGNGDYIPEPEEQGVLFPPDQFPNLDDALDKLDKMGMLKNFEGLSVDKLTPNRADGGQDIVTDKGVLTIWEDGTMRIQNFDGTGATLKQDKNGYTIHSWGPNDSNNIDISFIKDDGSYTVTEASGRATTTWPDGVIRVQNPDKTGFVQRPLYDDLSEVQHWGPNQKDNYSHIVTMRSI